MSRRNNPPPPPKAEPGDVVQIDPKHDPIFGACFLTITEVKAWGVQGYVRVPDRPQANNAPYRVEWEHVLLIGKARWMSIVD